MKKIALYLFFLLSILFLVDCLLYYNFLISYAGYYSDVILFWLWFVTSIFVIVLYWKKITAKLFLTAIVLAFVGSILPMMLPFYSFIFSMSPAGLKIDKNLNENYRAQIVGYSVMMHPWLEIIKKKGILEKKIFRCTDIDLESLDNSINVKYETQLQPELKISQAKDIIFKNETDSTLTVILFYGQPNKTLTFNKKNKKLMPIPINEAEIIK